MQAHLRGGKEFGHEFSPAQENGFRLTNAFGGVQATIEEEARLHAEALVAGAAGTLLEESGLRPSITVRQGDGPKIIREMIEANPGIAALVLGAAASGAPGPLVSHFAGTDAGALPIPLMIIPGSLDRDAIDRLS